MIENGSKQNIAYENQWLFVLCNKGTGLAGWWLKLTSYEELNNYLTLTNSRYGRAFENYLKDSFYQPSVVGHGPYIQEGGLTYAAYLKGVNRHQSFVGAITDLAGEVGASMLTAIQNRGAVYVNKCGGWNWDPGTHEDGDFVRREKLVWPDFEVSDIRISQFPGGQHFYAHVGNTQVIRNGRRRFNTRKEAEAAAVAYLSSDLK